MNPVLLPDHCFRHRSKTMGHAGVALTVIGSGAMVAGIATNPLSHRTQDEASSLIGVGIISLGAGITMTALGFKKKNIYKDALDDVPETQRRHP